MLADAGSGACAKHKHRFLHDSESLLTLKPSFGTKLLRVFTKNGFIELRDHRIHTDLCLH
jgi:hypothetical protein